MRLLLMGNHMKRNNIYSNLGTKQNIGRRKSCILGPNCSRLNKELRQLGEGERPAYLLLPLLAQRLLRGSPMFIRCASKAFPG